MIGTATGGTVAPPEAEFQPPRWLRDAHLQSILPSLPPHRYWARWRARALLAAAQPWELDCGDGVRLLASHTPRAPARARSGSGTAVLLHGWEGSADSCYVLCAESSSKTFAAIVRLSTPKTSMIWFEPGSKPQYE